MVAKVTRGHEGSSPFPYHCFLTKLFIPEVPKGSGELLWGTETLGT